MAIPKRIIQTWKTKNLPRRMEKYRQVVLSLHPDFEHVLFDDADIASFVRREFPEHQGIFDAMPYAIQRVDLFRYLAVYKMGGFYLDLDVWLDEPLHDLLDEHAVFPFELEHQKPVFYDGTQFQPLIGQYAFGAAPGHPFLKQVTVNIKRAIEDPSWLSIPLRSNDPDWNRQKTVLYTTGPVMVTRTFVQNPELQDAVAVLFPDAPSDPRTWSRFGRYGYHSCSGSWHPQRERAAQVWLDLKKWVYWKFVSRA